jgi:hypothetical protein
MSRRQPIQSALDSAAVLRTTFIGSALLGLCACFPNVPDESTLVEDQRQAAEANRRNARRAVQVSCSASGANATNLDCQFRATQDGMVCGKITLTCQNGKTMSSHLCTSRMSRGQVETVRVSTMKVPAQSCSNVSFRPDTIGEIEDRAERTRAHEVLRSRRLLSELSRRTEMRAEKEEGELVLQTLDRPDACISLDWTDGVIDHLDALRAEGINRASCVSNQFTVWRGSLDDIPMNVEETACQPLLAAASTEGNRARRLQLQRSLPDACVLWAD